MINTQTIPLTQGYKTIVDSPLPNNLSWILGVKWYAHFSTHGVYARNRTHGFLHRIVPKTPRHLESDHDNRDTLDNRRVNLKNCTHKTNCKNRDMSRNGRPKNEVIH